MSEIRERYWLIPLLKVEYSRKCFGIITPSTIVFAHYITARQATLPAAAATIRCTTLGMTDRTASCRTTAGQASTSSRRSLATGL
jgi:hypothetical protein